MNIRNYQPSLIWAKTETWYMAQQEQDARPYKPHELTLYVYRINQPGAWLMTGPKLYWQEEPMTGDYFNNCNQNELAENKEVLGECILWDKRKRKTIIIGKNFVDMWDTINK